MRPEILYPLFAPLRSLPGVGSRVEALLTRLAGSRVIDLIWHRPTGVIDRRYAPAIAEAIPGRVATLTVRIDRHDPPDRPPRPWRVLVSDVSGFLTLVFFHARTNWLESILPVGEQRVVSGVVEARDGFRQIVHPDHIVPLSDIEQVRTVEPVYPLTAGLTPKVVVRCVRAALAAVPDLPEWLDPALLRQRRWPAWREALNRLHAPDSEADLDPALPARCRLAYDELLAGQLALALVRGRQRRLPGRSVRGDGRLRETALAALPFELTGAQRRATAEITADQAGSGRMLRLLQGDVGSGKTVVAALAMLNAVEAGGQAALMAPTELLARQHLRTLAPLAGAAGVSVALLTGREKGRPREAALGHLADGTLPLVVGTHALLQEAVAFADLSLAVIDEQHRFGVHQRLDLAAKGRGIDVLLMTATPIPRTLLLSLYGDMATSRLDEKPPGRRPVDTRTIPLDRLEDVVAAVGRSLAAGQKVFWVCPLVEDSETVDAAAAAERYRALAAVFGRRVGLIHGRMKGAEKDAAMAAFVAGDTGILVATTVIEVGVDVPDATVMVIEHAERVGLAQLHQLRGRIGRGSRPSTCLLLYAPPLGETARARLAIMRETEDGFRIAEEDLRLRSGGEVLGTRQSGLPALRIADLSIDADLLAVARDDARLILERDPGLAGDRGAALRVLLYLFERDAAVRTLQAG